MPIFTAFLVATVVIPILLHVGDAVGMRLAKRINPQPARPAPPMRAPERARPNTTPPHPNSPLRRPPIIDHDGDIRIPDRPLRSA